jgi:hypothetical protein|tara:strand:+ start:438 stop:665 length:228 start_codon:yes stop_codon:yes gene_type:complete
MGGRIVRPTDFVQYAALADQEFRSDLVCVKVSKHCTGDLRAVRHPLISAVNRRVFLAELPEKWLFRLRLNRRYRG